MRLQQLENELRKLTGEIERNRFGVEQMGKRLDRLVRDVDLRLTTLERRPVPQPAPTTPTAEITRSTVISLVLPLASSTETVTALAAFFRPVTLAPLMIFIPCFSKRLRACAAIS